jgi:hypothetical protein
MPINSSLSFLPWLRSGLGAISEAQDDGKVRRKAAVTVDLVDENRNSQLEEKHTQPFILKGPGEVLGFSPLMVARTEPCNRENDFEPNYFPYIEFVDPDFPWRYSLDDNKDQLIPWIMLIVLKKDEFKITSKSKEKILKIKVRKNINGEFPLPKLEQLKQSWAWAHVQLSGNIPENTQLDKYIEENPGLHCSRLMCPRKLEEFTLYSAFVVPTYEIGRRAGLGMDVVKTDDYTPDNSLWKPSASEDDSFELPIYYMWQFQTSESGDFEELIDLIKCKEVPKDENEQYLVGIREINGSDPGYLEDKGCKEFPGDIFKLEGALVPPGFIRNKENTEDTEKREPIKPAGFVKCIRSELDKSLKEAPVHDDEDNDPLVSIPVYGRYFQKTKEIKPPDKKGKWKTSRSWIHETNLDRRYRVTASIGTTIVQENQEEYMKECWEQVGEIKEANEYLRLSAAGKFISDSLKERHIDPLSDERFTLITQPFHHYYIQEKGKTQQSFKAGFKTSGLPQGSISQPFKRIISQKVGFERQKLFEPWKLAAKNKSLWRIILRILLYIFRLVLEGLLVIIEQPDWFKRFILHLRNFCKRELPEDDGNVFKRIYRVILIALKLALKGIDLIITLPNRLKRWVPALIKILYLIKIPAPNEKPRLPDRNKFVEKELRKNLGITRELQDIYPLKSEIIQVTPINIKNPCDPNLI